MDSATTTTTTVMDRRLAQEHNTTSSLNHNNNNNNSSSSSSSPSPSPSFPSSSNSSFSLSHDNDHDSKIQQSSPSSPSSSILSSCSSLYSISKVSNLNLLNSQHLTSSDDNSILDCTDSTTFNSTQSNNTNHNINTNINHDTQHTHNSNTENNSNNNNNNGSDNIDRQDLTLSTAISETEANIIPETEANASITPNPATLQDEAVLEPESVSHQTFQSFFSPPPMQFSLEQMSMTDPSTISSMTDNFNGSMANNLLTSPRPHYTVRSFRTNNTSSPTGEILSLGPIDTNPNRIGTPESDPSTDDTVMTVTTQVSETDREEMEKERLEYQLKGRSLFSVGHPDDIEINNLMTTAPGRGQQLFSTDTISDSRPSQTMGRRSISKPKSPTTPTAPVSPVGSRHSSEMLPLSEFLSQSVDGVKVDNQSTVGLGSRIDDAPQPSYPMSSSFSTSPIPGLSFAVPTGKIRITNASGDLLGYQQQTPVHSDLKYSDQTQAHAEGVVSSHSHETTRSGTDSGVAAFSQDHDENDYLNQRKPIRNYKVFPGRNAFFFGGRIMTSHDFPAFIFAVMLVLIPTGLFHGFSSSYLWHRLSPAVPIIQAYVFIVAFSSMLKTSWTDPGVIPRGIDGDPPIDPPLEPNTFSYYPQGLQRQKEVQVGSHVIRLKYCETCKIYRPPRCSHCRQCDNCVEDEDHHCIWLNNCIGRRNYRYFLIFVSTMSMYAFLTFALCLTHLLLLYHDKRDSAENPETVSFSKDAMAKAPVAVLVMIFAAIMGLAVGSLACYHFWLATNNRTTHEQLTASMMRPHIVENPFDRGNAFRNCAAVLCRPPTRSYIRRRDYTVA